MPHSRQIIRERVAALLETVPALGSRVYAGRVYNLQPYEMPGATVRIPAEQSAPVPLKRTLERQARVMVSLYAKGLDTVECDLDDLALAVEPALGGDKTLGIGLLDFSLAATEQHLSAEGDSPHGVLCLTYVARYRTDPAAPGAIV